MEGGGWRVEGGGWRVEGGGWRVAGAGSRRSCHLRETPCSVRGAQKRGVCVGGGITIQNTPLFDKSLEVAAQPLQHSRARPVDAHM